MNFEYSQEQTLLRDSIKRYLSENYSFEKRRAAVAAPAPFCATTWQAAAELGWLALPFSDRQGGLDGSSIELMILFEQLGAHLVIEPFLETLVLCGGLLRRLACGAQRDNLIGQLMAGEWQCCFAHTEGAGWFSGPGCQAKKVPEGFVISGRKSVVYNAASANAILVSAVYDGRLAIFLVPSNSGQLRMRHYKTVDGRHAAELEFDKLVVPNNGLLAQGADAENAIDQTLNDAMLALAAEQVGMMRALLDMTVEYAKTRRQFGQPISNFQVLQHRMVDMYASLELVVSLMLTTAIKLRDQSADASAFAAALKVKADKESKAVAYAAFQLHGGIATSDELAVGHYLKRITVICHRFFQADECLLRYRRHGAR